MDPSQFEWLNSAIDWLTIIPEIALYAAWKILIPWIGVASIVAKITPSDSDNKIVDQVLGLLHNSALNPSVRKARESVMLERKK